MRNIVFLALLIALGIVFYAREHPGVLYFGKRPELAVAVLDVGQGDAIFAETANGAQMLVDGGPDDTVLAKLGERMSYGDRELDWVVLTHPDADHVSGLVSALRRYRVKNVLMTGVRHASHIYQAFLDELEMSGAQITFIDGPREIAFSGAAVESLYPFESLRDQWVSAINNSSIILRIEAGGKSFLLTGDSTAAVEKELWEAGAEVRADVLKVGHHGSRTSSGEEFLRAVRPNYALISAGQDNSFGHPHREVVRRLENQGARVLGTYERGDIQINVDRGGLCILAGSRIIECESSNE